MPASLTREREREKERWRETEALRFSFSYRNVSQRRDRTAVYFFPRRVSPCIRNGNVICINGELDESFGAVTACREIKRREPALAFFLLFLARHVLNGSLRVRADKV